MDTAQRLDEAARYIQERASFRPDIALVLGSGLGGLADVLNAEAVLPYEEIPHFPQSTAPGHAGKLLLGHLEGRAVAMMSGRTHLYERYEPHEAVFGVRLMRKLGARMLIVTNAAGGVNLDFRPGMLMLISDHINLTGQNPLVGPNDI